MEKEFFYGGSFFPRLQFAVRCWTATILSTSTGRDALIDWFFGLIILPSSLLDEDVH